MPGLIPRVMPGVMPGVMIDGCNPVQEMFYLRTSGEAGIKKNDLPQSPLSVFKCSPHFLKNAVQREGAKPCRLLMIVAIRTAANAAPDCFKPEDSLQVGIKGPKEIGRSFGPLEGTDRNSGYFAGSQRRRASIRHKEARDIPEAGE